MVETLERETNEELALKKSHSGEEEEKKAMDEPTKTNYGPDNEHHDHSKFSIGDVEDCYSFDANPNLNRSVKVGPEGHLLLPSTEVQRKKIRFYSASFVMLFLVLLAGCSIGYTFGKVSNRYSAASSSPAIFLTGDGSWIEQCSKTALNSTSTLKLCNEKCEQCVATTATTQHISCFDSVSVCKNVKDIKIKVEKMMVESLFSKNDADGEVDIRFDRTEADYYHALESKLREIEHKYGKKVKLPPPPSNITEICGLESLSEESRLAVCKDACEEAECCHNDIISDGGCYTYETAHDCDTYIIGCKDLATYLSNADN